MLPQIVLFGTQLSTYWLMFFLGAAGMLIACLLRTKYYFCEKKHGKIIIKIKASLFALAVALFGWLGTKILFAAENIEKFIENGFFAGGQSFFGALFLVPLMIVPCGKLLGLNAKASLDYCAPLGVLIIVFMRLGCFMNGCCGGILLGEWQVPVQLIEAIGAACIFAFLLYREELGTSKGMLYPMLLFGYGIMRFILEFFRDTEKSVFIFSNGHLFAMVAVAGGFAWITRGKYEKKT